MTPRFILSVVTLSLACIGSVQAKLQSLDLHQKGDQLLTLDDRSGLEWLDLTQSLNTNSAILAREMLPGGRYAGFQWAKAAEVKTLFRDAGWSGDLGKAVTSADVEAARTLVSFLGTTADFGTGTSGTQLALGRVADILIGPGVTTSVSVEYDLSNPNMNLRYAFFSINPWVSDNGSPAIGAFLFRPTSAVPEPTTTCLLLAGLGLLSVARHRRHK